MQTKLLMSLIAIGVAGLMMGAGTFAYFSDTATTEDNTFTAGTLDIQLANEGGSFGDDATATWVSPDGWAPGDEVTATLRFTNVGSIDIKQMVLNFNVASRDGKGDGSHLDDKIIITEWKEHFKNTEGGDDWIFDDLAMVEGLIDTADGNGVLTLAELESCTQFYTWTVPGPVTEDASWQGGDDVLLKGGNYKDYELELTFKFAEDAGNEYQGDSCTLEIVCDGTQNIVYS
jgi:predicted ribosomally synthesized peptide with SipW-like signal peptide